MSTTPDTTTRHHYTDAEIIKAACNAIQAPNMGTFTLPWFRAFLAALPERPQADEIAKIKAELAASRESESIAPSMQLQRLACEKGNKEAIQEVQKYASTLTVEGINGLLKAIHECLPETQPILADDGRSLGQVLHSAVNNLTSWDSLLEFEQKKRNDAAQAVAAVVLAQAVRRMEAVPVGEIGMIVWDIRMVQGLSANKAAEAIRARLVAAARGEGQAQGVPPIMHGIGSVKPNPNSEIKPFGYIQWHDGTCQPLSEAQPIGVNEPPSDEKQPDLSGESEKQDPYARLTAYAQAGARISYNLGPWRSSRSWHFGGPAELYFVHPDDLHLVPEYAPQAEAKAEPEEPAWIPHDGGPCPLKDEEVEEWSVKYSDQHSFGKSIFKPSELRWDHEGNIGDIIAYRVFRWKPGFGPEAKAEPAQPWTPAVGDVVRLKSGGPVMTVVEWSKEKQAWKCMGEAHDMIWTFWVSAACLTPAQP